MTNTYIIAEAGVNHNGSIETAFNLVDAAVEAGADAIKFQTFKTEQLVTKSAKQAEYQIENIGEQTTQYKMLQKLELTYGQFTQLKQYCKEKNIEFLSTPFDMESVDFLIDSLKLNTIKISSGEITNAPMLYKIAKNEVDVILSTGMASMEEIHRALAFLAYGYSKKNDLSFQKVMSFYHSSEAKKLIEHKVRILHCTTEYPTPIEDVQLKSMDYLYNETGLEVGLSDHSEGIIVPIAAVAKGATIIEKHFTLNKQLPGPDHKASLDSKELKEMIYSIRQIEKALGQYEKQPNEIELKNKDVARKSIVVSKNVEKGEMLTEENLSVKRPGNGIEPLYYWDYIGTMAEKDYEEDELLDQ